MGTRIDWTDEERRKVFEATVQMLKTNRVKTPPASPKELSAFMKVMRSAQVVLQENRRRPLGNIDAVSGDFLKMFIDGGYLPSNPDKLKKGAEKREGEDPNLRRINQLADERDAALSEATALKTQVNALDSENDQLRRRIASTPTEAEVVKKFVADILSQAFSSVPGVRAFQPIPVPPKDPVPKHQAEPTSTGPRKIHIAIVGGGPEHDKLQEEFKDPTLDLRLFDTRNNNEPIGDRLKAFKDPAYGKVLLWTNKTGHNSSDSLKFGGVPFEMFSGERGSMISRLKAIISDARRY